MTRKMLKRIQIIPAEVIMEDMLTHELLDYISPSIDIRKACRDYFRKYKLLCTDGVNAWNPYSDPHVSIPMSDFLIRTHYFVFNEIDLKYRRNALIRKNRREKKQERKCICGCGKIIPPEWSAKRDYYNVACRMRDKQRRDKINSIRPDIVSKIVRLL